MFLRDWEGEREEREGEGMGGRGEGEGRGREGAAGERGEAAVLFKKKYIYIRTVAIA